jgi:hypothetical protein
LDGKDLSSEEEWQQSTLMIQCLLPIHSGIQESGQTAMMARVVPTANGKKNLPALTIYLTAWPLLSKTRITNQLKPNQ